MDDEEHTRPVEETVLKEEEEASVDPPQADEAEEDLIEDARKEADELDANDDANDNAEGAEGAEGTEAAEDEEALLNEDVAAEDDVYSLPSFKNKDLQQKTIKRNVRRARPDSDSHSPVPMEAAPPSYEQTPAYEEYSNEDPETRKRRELEAKMDAAVKAKATKRRKVDYDDIERMQDDKIDLLKQQMVYAATVDVEKNGRGEIATEKLKLLPEVIDILLRADLAISVLDNNLLDAVRQWLEPLPDALMPAYQIQKELITALELMPIKTDHLVALGIGKVLVFYQRLKRTEASLKRIVDRLISDWTRPILNKSDSYKDRTIAFSAYDKKRYANQLLSQRVKSKEVKTLYEVNAERRNRAAIPLARTTAYKIAPQVDRDLLRTNRNQSDERFKSIQLKMTNMGRRKATKKAGPSIEGKGLNM